MRTDVVIDDDLMDEVLRVTGLKTKREAVELGLKTLIRIKQQEQIRAFWGKLIWEGDLEAIGSDSCSWIPVFGQYLASIWLDYFNGRVTPQTHKLDTSSWCNSICAG